LRTFHFRSWHLWLKRFDFVSSLSKAESRQ
jgi:hypothetical protein